MHLCICSVWNVALWYKRPALQWFWKNCTLAVRQGNFFVKAWIRLRLIYLYFTMSHCIVILIIQVPERLPSGDIEAIFSLCDSDYTFSMWQVPLFPQLLSLQSILTLHIIFTLANEMYQAVICFHTFSINSASPTESSWEKKSCIWT